jgi:hypothetical protein
MVVFVLVRRPTSVAVFSSSHHCRSVFLSSRRRHPPGSEPNVHACILQLLLSLLLVACSSRATLISFTFFYAFTFGVLLALAAACEEPDQEADESQAEFRGMT